MVRRLHHSRYFVLQQETNAKGRRFYKIVLWNSGPMTYDEVEQIRDMLDPLRNRAGRRAYGWKFSNRKDAEQRYMALLLKWA